MSGGGGERVPSLGNVADRFHRYSHAAGPSEMERKMQVMMEQSNASDHEDSSNDDDEAIHARDEMDVDTAKTSASSLLAALPIELIDRILSHVIEAEQIDTSQLVGTTSMNRSSMQDIITSYVRAHQAANLCLVCKQFDQLNRSKMYRSITVPVRTMRSFLQTIQANDKLASMVKELTLDSRIWTDIDENVIARIFLTIRSTCKKLKVGANESSLLPYLVHGVPSWEREDCNDDKDATYDEGRQNTCALEILDLCWRDEVDVGSQHHNSTTTSTGESIPKSDTLRALFQHQSRNHRWDTLPPCTPPPRLQHLVIDLYSQSQLNQLFEAEGYFTSSILPQLTSLRIEMPLVVLQFTCAHVGGLVQGWPQDDWQINQRNIQDAIETHFEQSRRLSITNASTTQQPSSTSSGTLVSRQQADATTPSITPSDEVDGSSNNDILVMPLCPANQMKCLVLRFLLNVHRNDMTLFRLLMPPQALDQSWSTRASITAQCLSTTLQSHLNAQYGTDNTSKISATETGLVYFPFAVYKAKGPEAYWDQKWSEAEQDHLANLSGSAKTADQATKVSLLLRWPNAVDAFFHYSAMT